MVSKLALHIVNLPYGFFPEYAITRFCHNPVLRCLVDPSMFGIGREWKILLLHDINVNHRITISTLKLYEK